MKIIALFCALLAVSLAAPSADEKPVIPEKIEDEAVSQNDEKVVGEVNAPSLGEKTPIVVVATSVDEDGKDDVPKTDEEKAAIHREYADVCRASTGATEEQVAAIAKDPAEDAPKAVKCYIKCLNEKYGVEKDNVIQMDVARRSKPSSISDEQYEKILETCGALASDDPCDSSYLRYSCYFRESGEKARVH